jgi:Uma2 family endonuclease
MTYTPTKTLTFDEFIAQYGDDFRYELADGELIDMEPIGPHEAVGGKLATHIGIAINPTTPPLVDSPDLPDSPLLRPSHRPSPRYCGFR